MEGIAEILRAEADECLKSSQGNGAYNDAFYVAAIVLQHVSKKLEALGQSTESEGA
jgi:hypothetical protein